MASLVVGIILSLFLFAFCLVIFTAGGNSIFNFVTLLPMMLFFWAIAIVFIVKGVKKVNANKRTEMHGEDTFGFLLKIKESGLYVNNTPELEGTFLVYVSSLNKVVEITETIGFDDSRYRISPYVRLKYFEGDINIEDILIEEMVPEYIRKRFEQAKHTTTNIIFGNGLNFDKESSVEDNINPTGSINSKINNNYNYNDYDNYNDDSDDDDPIKYL